MTEPTTRYAPGTFTPAPRRASAWRMASAQTRFELRLLLRNGEQLLLALVIPIAALIGLTKISVIDLDEPRIDTVTPGIFTLAIMSTAFTSLAIATAFDRRYGAAKRLAAAGVPRWLLITGKIAGVFIVIVGQLLILSGIALLLGWDPAGSFAWALLMVLLGAAAFGGLGLLVGGTLRAEAVLALANIVWLVLVGIGGVIVPLSSGGLMSAIGQATPAGALSHGLRDVLQFGTAPSLTSVLVLLAWSILGWLSSIRWFRWQ
ncbi:multidrug ABC transporter permease [Nakamurella silvestris]|nr:multidrug ABC transporter permease [Nakamurella silvestris]